ncbi:hypothetical protein BDZ85DRAFT_256687 [Elsinoe ampelina]|uniref:C2H2-type domain-containing protein n=1 Tax=Elsinoe ampelina TaxID=302913 RepID=A0A6A6GM88_9PEZI|nr:hypothetical protein BDZ85DRAFT_256687 [Elsinoe ampelina]
MADQNQEGQIREKIRKRTVSKIWHCTQRNILKGCRQQLTEAERKVMSDWIMKVLPRRKMCSTKRLAKAVAGPETAADLVVYLWAHDEDEMHPRMRLQLSLLLLILLYNGLRPGEFMESVHYPDSNEGLLYGDFVLILVRNAHRDDLRWLLEVRLRNRKWRRHDEGLNEWHLLKMDSRRPHLCPVSHYIGLALADNALEGISSVSELERVRLSDTAVSTRISCKPEMERIPVIRRMTEETRRQVSADKIIRYDAFKDMLRRLGARAGYTIRLTPYQFRRGHANILDSAVTPAERRQRMGHVDDTALNAYISQISGVDTQAIIHGEAQEQDLFHKARSISSWQDFGSSSSSTWQAGLERKVKPRRDALKQFREESASRQTHTIIPLDDVNEEGLPPGSDGLIVPFERPAPSVYMRAILEAESDRKQIVGFMDAQPSSLEARISPFVSLSSTFHNETYYPRTRPDRNGGCPHCMYKGPPSSKPKSSAVTAFKLHLLQCRLKADAKLLDSSTNNVGQPQRCAWQCCGYLFTFQKGPEHKKFDMDHLKRHIQRACSQADGRMACLWTDCKESVPDKSRLESHLAEVHCGTSREHTAKIEYCFQHREYYSSKAAWSAHCTQHLKDMGDKDLFCGIFTRREIVICAGICIFCIGDQSLSATQRFRQFSAWDDLKLHVEQHMQNFASRICPHPRCTTNLSTKGDAQDHFWNVHGMRASKTQLNK